MTVDATPPTPTAGLQCVGGDDAGSSDGGCEVDEGLFQVMAACSDDSDPDPSFSATLNGIGVANGQIVGLELDDDHGQEAKYDDGLLEIEASDFVLAVTCTGQADNSATATASPEFTSDDDSSDDD